jgi:thiamine pyrophosphate-dependent acetolactate synthase large subunit-like protein
LLKSAKRPVVYSGGGVINAGDRASAALVKFVRMTGFPCTSTLMGLGAYPSNDPQFLGMLGVVPHRQRTLRHFTFGSGKCLTHFLCQGLGVDREFSL